GLPQAGINNSQNAPEHCPIISLQYRNVEAVYFRAIRYDWESFLQKRHNRPESLSEAERREVLNRPAALEWSEQLPPTADFKQKTVALQAPTTLKPGFYFIASSHDPKFSEKQNIVSLATVWVTDLSLITRVRDGLIEGFVLAANSGEPIEGADLSIWHLDQTGNRVADPGVRTDTNGLFTFKAEPNRSYLLRAGYKRRELATAGDLWNYNNVAEVTPQAQTVFFTDRGLYRPGQTIQFKGICVWVDQNKDDYQVLKGEGLTVVFRDQNGKEIARQPVRANDYGSFAGSFVAPRDRLMGQMSLQVEGRAQGMAAVRVEEYKRPKFQVTLEAPKTAAKLAEKVSLTGHAMTYAGAAVDAAPVRYRVVRQARMPWWWGWYGRPWRGSDSQEIAHGTVTTEVDGSFKIEFTAKPDLKIPESDEPTFVYQVNADVTDSAGETRSAEQNILVGYTALTVSLSANDWQTANLPVAVTVSARTLDGEPQVAEGRVLIYDLQAPAKPEPAPIATPFPSPYLSRRSKGTPFAAANMDDQSNPNNWPLGKVVAESGFTTDTNGEAKLSFKLSVGVYRAVIESQDRFGKKVTGRLPIQVLEPDSTHLAIKVPHLFTAPSWEAQPGQQFTALWGTGYEFGRAFVELEHRHRILRQFWTDPDKTQQQIQVAVTEAMRGGFTLHVTHIRENRAYLESRKVEVPWINKELDVKWEHFVSKLQPNQKETWTAVVSRRAPTTGPNGAALEQKAAEMVATMYDESLDAFAPFAWQPQFGIFRQDYSSLRSEFANQAAAFQYALGAWGRPAEGVAIVYRSFPRDLTTTLWGYSFFGARGLGGGVMTKTASLGRALMESENLASAAPAALALDAAVAGAPSGSVALSQGKLEGSAPKNLGQVAARKNLNETAF
ncbi:MAG TPA: MG2 domain-containing protein, partial [Candidatus Dormibacteraeota bacterium]|nr:MG2 domain-containing protein [Candidatus Dormibacteraeota bacterium]